MVISLSPDFQGCAVSEGGEITGNVAFWVMFSDQKDYSDDVEGWTSHRLALQVTWGRQAGHNSMNTYSMSLVKVLKSPCSQFLYFLKGKRWHIVEILFKSNIWGKFLAEWDIFEVYDPFTSRCTKKSSHTLCRHISPSLPCI